MASQDGDSRRSSSSTGSKRLPRSEAFLQTGQMLNNNYEVHEQIGEGGMAIVYRATQLSLSRSVAIKALHPKFARDAEFIARFEAESGALAALSHPNIVSIIDRGCEREVYYFVMEFVDGANLDEKIIGKVLTPNDWRQVVTSCSSALDYVHKRGVVHRDIKPSNILIDSEGRVKIGDFGIAHMMLGDGGYQGPAKAVGTAHYMAPEQTHDPANVDSRADVYALGVTFYKMLARQLPIGEFPAPSEANRDVPVAVDAVIFQAMAPNRDDRFQSVKEFCEEMQRALKDNTASISSILNYRAAGGGALYTGTDFRTPVPSAPSSAEVKKIGTDPGTKGKTGTGTGTGTGGGQSGSGSRVKGLTPVPTRPGSGTGVKSKTKTGTGTSGVAAAPKAAVGRTPVIIGILAAVFVGLIVTVLLMIQGAEKKASPTANSDPNSATTPVRSAAAEREERSRLEREKEQQELLNKRRAEEDY